MFKKSLVWVFAAVLMGCASAPEKKVEAPAEEMIYIRPFAKSLNVEGRMVLQHTKKAEPELYGMKFIWLQMQDNTIVTLLNAAGQTQAIIEMTPTGAKLTPKGQKVQSGANVDDLVERQLGLPLPLNNLRTWMQGFGTDSNNKDFIANPDNSKIVTKQGWTIEYGSWQNDGLPRLLNMTKTTPEPLSLRIAIDTLQIPK